MYICGVCPAPRTPTYGKGICGALPHTPPPDHYIWGFAPNPDLGNFFGKKFPKNPKKPNWMGFRLSSIDSKQGCRRQPCFCVWQSNSNFVVCLPNVSEKDVKGLLFRSGAVSPFEIEKAFQTLSSACRTQVRKM